MLLGALITAVADPLRPEVLPDPLLGIFTMTLTRSALPYGMLSRVQSTVLASREQVQPSPLGSSITSAPGGSWIVMTGFDTGSGPALDASATITTGSLGFGPVGLRLTLIDRSEPLGVRFPTSTDAWLLLGLGSLFDGELTTADTAPALLLGSAGAGVLSTIVIGAAFPTGRSALP